MSTYYLGIKGAKVGPLTASEVHAKIVAGQTDSSTLAWREGLEAWKPLSDLLPEILAQQSALDPNASSGLGPETVVPQSVAANQTIWHQAVPDYELASPWIRLVAHILDNLIGFLFMIPALIVLFIKVMNNGGNPPDEDEMVLVFLGVALLCGLPLIIWQCIWISTRGQSIGKRIMGVRIVKSADCEPPGFVSGILMRAFVPGLVGSVPYIGGVFSLADILFIFASDHRCLHDMMAGTIVIVGQPPAKD